MHDLVSLDFWSSVFQESQEGLLVDKVSSINNQRKVDQSEASRKGLDCYVSFAIVAFDVSGRHQGADGELGL